jgi:hypothetical protein
MRLRLIVLMMIFFTLPPLVRAETLQSTKEISQFLETLCPSIVQGKIREVFDKIRPYWPIPAQEVDVIVYQLENQKGQVVSRFGKPLAMERVDTLVIGDVFYREVYLLKYEKHAVAWVFTFYKPSDQWRINSVFTSDQMNDFFRKK